MPFDLLEYLRGDGRLYELQFDIDGQQGTQTVQTQLNPADPLIFYHVKGQNFERLYADDNFIYREADTSEAADRYYIQTTDGQPGAIWAKRFMAVGEITDRNPLVVHYFKHNCAERARGSHATQLQLIAVHDTFMFDGGIELDDVMELGWLVNGAFVERYFYAKGFGLVAWSGINRGQSFISEIHQNRPDLVREVIPCLPAPVNLYYAPAPIRHVRVVGAGLEGLNVRTQPEIAASTLISAVADGTVFEVVKQNPTWWQVELFKSPDYAGGRVLGFVHGAFVETTVQTPPADPAPNGAGAGAEFVEVFGTGGTGLNVRTQPTVSQRTLIATLREGAILEVASRAGVWVQVVLRRGVNLLGGQILAWVHGNFVRTIANGNGNGVPRMVIDVVDALPKHPTKVYGQRNLANVDAHVVHHTVSPRSTTPAALASFHVNGNDWPGIGYTFVITADGRVFQTNRLNTKSFATVNQNHRYLSTALTGDFRNGQQPTPAQIDSLSWLHNEWLPAQLGRDLPLIGHKEGDGQATACPGDSWDWSNI